MFAVLVAQSIPDHVRGYLSRFLQEAATGVYIGVVTDRVAEALWDQTTTYSGSGELMLVTSDADSETGYQLRLHNIDKMRVHDFDGISLPLRLT